MCSAKNPNDAAANNELAWFYETAADRRYRNPAAALEIAQEAVKLAGGSQSYMLDTLAEAYYVNLAKALTTEKKVELDPKNGDLQAQLRKYQVAALSPEFSILRELW